MEKVEKIVLILAIFLLFIGFASGVYLELEIQENEDIFGGEYLEVEGLIITMDDLFSQCSLKNYLTDRGNYTGFSLSCVINISNLTNPEIHDYAIVSMDGYTKTVSWDDMKKGIITDERYTVFSHLPRAYWIKDVIKIEVG